MNNSVQEYTFKINQFDGPLDLLLALIKDKKMSIFDVDVSELATQYLQIINQLKENEIDIAGDYLLMAATLIDLKAKMVLKEPDQVEEVQQEKESLINQLVEYQQFKEVKEALKTFRVQREEIFIKKPSNIEDFVVDSDDSRLDGYSNPIKLITVLQRMFERRYAQELRHTTLETIKLTPADQFGFIKKLLANNETVTFEMVFNQPTIGHFVITLLALLDLARQQQLIIIQEHQFGNIVIKKGSEFNEK
ncbi:MULTISPECIES: segregation/condensation protein A [unclassified Mycoplasma]|uniref:segregation/condensation protein A n=1 Tax=unclassified Mycoplasma TaxID=2683645 RepID=UPI00211BE6E3|nr:MULTISPECIES: segregation/condensation protein A [unclassified Mycoplasma]UUM19941.1 segregation/condensation protein A [Mycoplasma sp. 1578d]UUM24922.1 segregation/condensation protein A [Mycoplasma sp. 3686d]